MNSLPKKCAVVWFVIFAYYKLILAVDYDWLWDNVVQDLDINKLSGQWDALYAKFSGFRCLNIYFDTNKNKSIDTRIRIGEKVILDHFLLKRIEPLGNTDRKLGALYRTHKFNRTVRTYHWFVLDIVYDNYFIAYQEFNSNNSQDFWAIYTRPDRECGIEIVNKATKLLENVKIKKLEGDRLLYKADQTKNCADNVEMKPIERYFYYFSSGSVRAIHVE